MAAMRVRRYRYRRQGCGISCGCLSLVIGGVVVAVVVILILIPALPGIAVRLMGFSPVGDTGDVFARVTPVAPPQLESAVTLPQVSLDLGTYGLQALPQTGAVTVAVDNSRGIAVASATESGLIDLCYQVNAACADGNGRYRNPRIDLRPGGAVVYVDVRVPTIGIWQTAGIVLRLRGAAQFEVAGVDVNGVLYEAPPNNLGDIVSEVERIGNDVLRQLTLRAGGGNYTLSEVYIDDTTATLVLR
jgi:hypothetical protein